MIGSGREALTDVRDDLSDVQECSEAHPGCQRGSLRIPGVVGRPSRLFGSGQETLPNVRDWWEALPDAS